MSMFSTKSLLNSRWQAITLGLILLGLIGYLDWETGPALSMTVFYMVPIGVLAIVGNKPVAYAACFFGTAVWYWMNFYPDPLSAQLLWNATIRLSTFLILTYIIFICVNLRGEINRLVVDRTSVLEAEVKTRREAEEAIRSLTYQLEVSEDLQRRQIAQDIHDTLGQNLSLLKIRLQSLASHLPASNGNTAEIMQIAELLDQLIQQTRALTFDLHPAMLDDLGLVPTLRHYAKQTAAQTSIPMSVSEIGHPVRLAPPTAGVIFRAVKELVHNAVKHASPKEILVTVHWKHGMLRVIVDDDGAGSAEFTPESKGLGLRWIRKRLDDARGQMQIESHPGGTRVITDWPLPLAAPASSPFVPVVQETLT